MWESAIGGIAVPIFEQLWKAGGKVAGQIREAQEDVQEVENILKASQNYRDKYEARHGQVKVMPGLMKEPVPLDSIYTAVKFLDEFSLSYFATPGDLEQLYRDQGKRSFQAAEKRYDGISIAKEKQYLMVLGGPGIGKSTFLRKLGLEALKGAEFTQVLKDKDQRPKHVKRSLIPIFIELKTFRAKSIDLIAIIAEEFEICGFPDSLAFTTESLKQGKLLLLLDGLDEVPGHRMNLVIEQIEAFATQYDKNTFVASCRTAAYRSSFKQFIDVTIADFDDEQIEQFIQRWFNSKLDKEADTANQYWWELSQPENNAAKELAQTPLLLTFLCLIYEREQMLPSRRSTLYGRALNILLSEWSAQKRLNQAPIYKDLHPELEKEMLSSIAYNSLEEDRLFFSKSDIINRITTYLADILDAPKYLNGPAVLHAIEVQQGILVERAMDTYSFSHLTLQEYLTAFYINKKSLIQVLVSQHLFDQRWREVFLLVIGLMGSESITLLKAIDQQARTYINDQPKVRHLVQWASTVIQGSPSQYDDFEKIAVVIAITSTRVIGGSSIGGIARAIIDKVIVDSTINRAIASYTVSSKVRVLNCNRPRTIMSNRDMAIAIAVCDSIISIIDSVEHLNKLKIFNTSVFKALPNQLKKLRGEKPEFLAPVDEWLNYADKIEATWLNALGLKKEELSLSKEEWECFANYLYAYELLLRCRKSSIGISRKSWEALKARLLKIDWNEED